VQIAFKDFSPMQGILGSEWIGFEHFERFFASYQFWVLLRNTLVLSLYETLAGFPIPILLALMINSVRANKFKRAVQTITYAPHFISTVVIAGMLYLFLSPRNGFINEFISLLGFKPIFFMGEAGWFRDIFVFSGIWQNGGWSAIIYLAALTSVNPELHESAVIDGASKLQRVRHIDLPAIVPTIVILLILNIGKFMTVSFQKVLLMQNYLNIETVEIIQTYVYKTGLLGAQFSYSAAIGLLNNIVNMILLVSVNRVAKMLKQTSLWQVGCTNYDGNAKKSKRSDLRRFELHSVEPGPSGGPLPALLHRDQLVQRSERGQRRRGLAEPRSTHDRGVSTDIPRSPDRARVLELTQIHVLEYRDQRCARSDRWIRAEST
jgi:putative aldouronate transport system permease protein